MSLPETVTSELCVACGHPIGKHFKSVDNKVRCIYVDNGVSTRGIIGMPYSVECDCVDYVSPSTDSRKTQDIAIIKERQKELDEVFGPGIKKR